MFHLFIILFCSFILFLDVFSLRFNRIRQEGKEEGLKEGELLKAKEKTLMLFKSKYPQENVQILENLTLLQYDQTFDALLENEDLKTIKKIIGK